MLWPFFSTKIYPKLLPNSCVFCKLKSDTNISLCSICYNELPWLVDACDQCGAQLVNGNESIRCQKCIISPPNFDRFCALFSYKAPISNLITKLKFKNKLAYGNLLGQLLLAKYPVWYQCASIPEAIIPVPLSNIRLRVRGFNQVREILRPLTTSNAIPILDHICIRKRHTIPQTKTTVTYRRRNVKGSFCLTTKIPYRHIAIVDDVFTTGSTVRAVSDVLRRARVQQIDVWCICRA